MKIHWSLLVLLMAATACTSAEERAQLRAQKEMETCTKRGLQPDTPAFEDCRLEVRAQAESEKEQRVNGFDSLRMIESNHPGEVNPF